MNCFKGGSSVLWQVAGFNSLGFEIFFFLTFLTTEVTGKPRNVVTV